MLHVNVENLDLRFQFGYLGEVAGHILVAQHWLRQLRVMRLKEAIYLAVSVGRLCVVFPVKVFFVFGRL